MPYPTHIFRISRSDTPRIKEITLISELGEDNEDLISAQIIILLVLVKRKVSVGFLAYSGFIGGLM